MKKVKLLFAIISAFRLLPHFIVLLLKREEKIIIKSDISVNSAPYNGWLKFVYLMTFEKSFRNLFYHRIGFVRHCLQFLCRPEPYLKINSDLDIGVRCRFTHAHTTYINCESIGTDFVCFHLVTIGRSQKGLPIIGNNVKVFANAMILGKVRIGNNVVIGAGSVVTKDIPDNSLVLGNPAKIINKESSF